MHGEAKRERSGGLMSVGIAPPNMKAIARICTRQDRARASEGEWDVIRRVRSDMPDFTFAERRL